MNINAREGDGFGGAVIGRVFPILDNASIAKDATTSLYVFDSTTGYYKALLFLLNHSSLSDSLSALSHSLPERNNGFSKRLQTLHL